MISLYIAPLFLLCISIFIAVLVFATPSPKATDFSEIRGHLESYHIYRDSHGRYPKTIVILEEGHRFWTAALDQDGAADVLKKRGVEVRTYVLIQSTKVPIDDAAKSYGLWVNGQQIESLDADIAWEEFIFRVFLPALAIFITALAVYIFIKNRGKYTV